MIPIRQQARPDLSFYRNAGASIEANFTAKEVDNVLILTVGYAELAAITKVQFTNSILSEDATHIEKIYEQMRAYNWHS